MIDLYYYDTDMVYPLPHVFNGTVIATPPKNASSYIQVAVANYVQAPSVFRVEYQNSIAVVRDPIDRWCSAVNQQRKRIASINADHNDEHTQREYEFWCQSPDVIVNCAEIMQISEFCLQSDWSGPTSLYDRLVPVSSVDAMLRELDIHPPPELNHWRNESVNGLTVKDLNETTKRKIREIYSKDFDLGWHTHTHKGD